MSNSQFYQPYFLSLLGNQYKIMSSAIIISSPLAIRRESPNTSLSEDESGPLALSEPTGGNIVWDAVAVGVIMVIGVALATGVVGVVGVVVVVGVGVILPTVRVVWARNAPVAMSLALTVTCETSRLAGKWKLPLIFPFLSATQGYRIMAIMLYP